MATIHQVPVHLLEFYVEEPQTPGRQFKPTAVAMIQFERDWIKSEVQETRTSQQLQKTQENAYCCPKIYFSARSKFVFSACSWSTSHSPIACSHRVTSIMENASELLQASLSPLQTERENATAQLTQFLASNPSQYLISLSNSLVNNATPSHIRNAAGLAIKNTLSARESSRQEEYALRWKALDSQTREKLKADALASLAATDRGARNVAGQVVAAIATIELPAGLWNDLIANLLELVGHSDNTGLRQATLQAIGYICESIVSSACSIHDTILMYVTG